MFSVRNKQNKQLENIITKRYENIKNNNINKVNNKATDIYAHSHTSRHLIITLIYSHTFYELQSSFSFFF